jgi:hypothetical protein
MKKSYVFVILLLAGIIFAFKYFTKRRDEIRIYPLSPYADSIKFTKDEDVSNERRNGIQIKFYVIEENVEYNQQAKDKMDAYITKYLRKELKTHPAIYFTFYKEASGLDRDSQHTLADLNNNHLKDKFAEYEYINAKLFNFDFYKNGEYYEPNAGEDPNN